MKKTPLILTLALPFATANAALVSSVGSGDWNATGTWSDASAPDAANDYSVESGHTVTSPSSAAETFGGNSLTVKSGGILELYRNIGGSSGQTITADIPNLTIQGGTLRSRVGFATGHTVLSSSLIFDGGGNIEVGTTLGTYSHNFTFNGAITGNGDVSVFRDDQGSGRGVIFNGDLAAFSGNWSFTGSPDTGTFNGEPADEVLGVSFGAGSNGWGLGNIVLNDAVNLTLNTGDIVQSGSIFINDTSTTLNLGSNSTTVGGLNIAGNDVTDGVYTADQLNSLGYGGNFTGTGTLTVTSIPEPTSSALIGLAGIGFLLRRRR